ncbi:MAG: cold shock domain-containing protein [Pseudomonadota bacterium]
MNNAAGQVTKLNTDSAVRLTGRIKWFDAVKGYGFVVPEAVDGVILNQDVMLHVSCLRAYGENAADEGARIVCEVVERERGWQVLSVIEMDRPRASVLRDQGEPLVFERVVVKWFNASQGFGFVNRPGQTADIFIHISVMRKAGIDMLETGMEIDVVTGNGQKGENVMVVKK